jgi:phage terminase large subunit
MEIPTGLFDLVLQERYEQEDLKAPRTTNTWPVDYGRVMAWRRKELKKYEDKQQLQAAKRWYRTRPIDFINHWCDTHDPRNIGKKDEQGHPLPVILPLVMFKRQEELVVFIHQCMERDANGLIEKSRDMGATWTCISLSTHQWLFEPNNVIGWGSATADKLDKLSDPDTIFEKFRLQILGLPLCFRPPGLTRDKHLLLNRLINPENRSIITGEIGDKIGRGGRTKMYIVDEAAHLEHPDLVEGGLSENTRCRIDISSVSGLGTVFHRTRRGGKEWVPGGQLTRDRTNVFIMDWSHHPAKTRAWYVERQKLFESKGMGHVFAQEVDRDYAAAVQGTVIPRKWLESCVDAHLKIHMEEDGINVAGLDVADEGKDSNALVARKGWIINFADQWAERDTGKTTRRALALCKQRMPCELQYDSIGVGSGVKAEANRLKDDEVFPRGLKMVPWNAGAKVVRGADRVVVGDLQSPTNKDFYHNLKAQGWWTLRLRVYLTHMAITEGREVNGDDCISFDSKRIEATMLVKLLEELSQATASPNTKMKMVIDKSPDGMASPNLGDACVICCFPVPDLTQWVPDNFAPPVMVSQASSGTCGNCGSDRIHQLGQGRYQCHKCGYLSRTGTTGYETFGGRR